MTRHKKQDSAELLFLIVVAIAAMLFCFAVGLSVEKHYGTRKVAANSAQVSKDSDRVKKENKELRMTVRDQQRILDQNARQASSFRARKESAGTAGALGSLRFA